MEAYVNIEDEHIWDAVEGYVNDAIEDRLGEYVHDSDLECQVASMIEEKEIVTADMVTDVTAFENRVRTLEAQVLGMQAEIDFLHEKYMDLLERRIGYRVSNFVSNVRSLPARLWARVPKFTITRKDG